MAVPAAFLFYAFLTLLFLAHLVPVWSTHILGGLQDTNIFLWNAWYFRAALHTLYVNPYFTRMLFYPWGGSLVPHDYPLSFNLVTYAAQAAGWNVIAACNLSMALSWLLAGFCTYLLAREVTVGICPARERGDTSATVLFRGTGRGKVAPWLRSEGTPLTRREFPALAAGLVVMTSSYMLARAMQNWGQFNVYGIALFFWTWLRAHRTGRTRDYILAGLALAWTAACHYYFLVQCILVWMTWVLAQAWPWRYRWVRRTPPAKRLGILCLSLAVLGAAAAGWIAWLHPRSISIGSLQIGLESPANAAILMWISMMVWYASRWRVVAHLRIARFDHINPPNPPLEKGGAGGAPHSRRSPPDVWRRFNLRGEFCLIGMTFLCLSPLLASALKLTLAGDYPRQSILWKTHLLGTNLLAFFTPNALQALWGPTVARWLTVHGIHPQEQAAGLGYVVLVLVCTSQAWKEGPAARRWLAVTGAAMALSMGPYLHILQWNLWCPLPFYVARLLPVLNNVRVPERWMGMATVGSAVLVAISLVRLSRERRWRLGTVCTAAGALILFENWPGLPVAPAPADLPTYQMLRRLPPGGVLALPFYIGDSSIGAGGAAPSDRPFPWTHLGAQIYHQHPIFGGYVGRMPHRLIARYKAIPFFKTLIDLEEGTQDSALRTQDLRRMRSSPQVPSKRNGERDSGLTCREARELDLAYVLSNPPATPAPAWDFVRSALPLTLVQKDPGVELYRVDCPN
jgi:hypothetical protein